MLLLIISSKISFHFVFSDKSFFQDSARLMLLVVEVPNSWLFRNIYEIQSEVLK